MPSSTTAQKKASIRSLIHPQLLRVALPDSRFHYDFSSFITDFHGSETAISILLSHPSFVSSSVIFITPDNCLESLRYQALNAGKTVLVTTYGIRRGFYLLDPQVLNSDILKVKASLLDTMEKVGQPITLHEMVERGLSIDLLVTGTGAVDARTGLRFGKGHGFFDLEWAILTTLKLVNPSVAKVVGLCHDCQVVNGDRQVDYFKGQEFIFTEDDREPFDTLCDLIVTNTCVLNVKEEDRKELIKGKPSCGIIWEKLEANMLGDIPVLNELKEMTS